MGCHWNIKIKWVHAKIFKQRLSMLVIVCVFVPEMNIMYHVPISKIPTF